MGELIPFQQPIIDAITKAREGDGKLTEQDKENRDIQINIRRIQTIWSPEMPETPEYARNRSDLLGSLLLIARDANISHQEIADWIYGPGRVNVESHLKDSYFDSVDVDYGRMPVKRLIMRVTSRKAIDAKIYKDNKSGKYGVTIYESEFQRVGDYEGWTRNAILMIPLFTYASFEEAHQVVLNRIQSLRKKEKGKDKQPGWGTETPPDWKPGAEKKELKREEAEDFFKEATKSNPNTNVLRKILVSQPDFPGFLRQLAIVTIESTNRGGDDRLGKIRDALHATAVVGSDLATSHAAYDHRPSFNRLVIAIKAERGEAY